MCCALAASKWCEQHRLMRRGYYWNAAANVSRYLWGQSKWNRPISVLTACLQAHAVRLVLQQTVALVAAGGEKEEEEGGKNTHSWKSYHNQELRSFNGAAVNHFATKEGHFLSGPQRSLIRPLVCGWNMWKHLLFAWGHVGILRAEIFFSLFFQHWWEIQATQRCD